jgi:hypothetical protein
MIVDRCRRCAGGCSGRFGSTSGQYGVCLGHLQYPKGDSAESLGLTGTETFSITGITALKDGSTPRTVQVTTETGVSFDARGEDRHPGRGGLLPARRHPAERAA